jgi:TP901 family phage tail tape measure protein
MANDRTRLEYEVRLRDLASQALQNMGRTAEQETSKARKAFKKLEGAAKAAGVALGAAAGALVAVGFKKGVDRAIQFERAMAEVNTILGEGSISIDRASESVLRLARELGEPAPEIAAGMYQTLSAGVTDAEQALMLLESATKGAIAGLSTTQQSVDLLTTIFNAYKIEVTEGALAATNDMIFKTIQLGKTTMPELAASMGQVLPSASALGVTFEEVAGAVASLTLNGLSTAEAVTQINAVITAFLKKGESAKELFGDTSDVMGGATLRAKGFQQAINDLMEAAGDEDTLTALMGRVEGAKAVMALTGAGAERFSRQLEGVRDSAGAADQALEKMFGTMDRRIKVVQENATQAFADMSTEVLMSALGLKNASVDAQTFAKRAEDMSEALKPLEILFAGVAAMVGVFATGLLTVVVVAQSARVALLALGDAMNPFQEGLSAGTKEALADVSAAYENLGAAAISTRNILAGQLGMDQMGFEGIEVIKAKTEQWRKAAAEARGELLSTVGPVGKIKAETEGLAAAAEHGAASYGELSNSLSVTFNAALDSINRFNEASLATYTERVQRAREAETIIQMLMEEGFDKEMRKIEAKTVADIESFKLRKEAARVKLAEDLKEANASEARLAKELSEFDAAMREQVRKYTDARLVMEQREVERLKKTQAEQDKAEKRAAHQRELFMREHGEIIAKNLANPITLALSYSAKVSAQAFVDAFDERKRDVADLFGPALADGLQGALANIGSYVQVTPEMEFNALTANLAAAKEQIAAAFGDGLINDEQAESLAAVVANVEKFALAEVEAAKNTEAFKASLDSANPAVAGMTEGLQKFIAEIPTLRDGLADITERSLEMFAAGLSRAFMELADGSKSAKQAFSDFARQFVVQVGQMIAQLLILQAIKVAFPGLALANGGVVEGGMGDVTPLAMGGVVPGGLGRATPVRGYANGGPIVREPHVALIGEGQYNEAVVPLPDGRSIPVDMRNMPGANISFTINTVDARGFDSLLLEREETIRSLVQRGMRESRGMRQSVMRG